MGLAPVGLAEASRRIGLGVAGANLPPLCRNGADFCVVQVGLLISGPKSAVVTNERFN
jgi:hypothetical protein